MRKEVIIILLLFLLALTPRLLYVMQIQSPPFSDMADYNKMAVKFLIGDGLVQSPQYQAYRPPGYPLFLAFIYSIMGHSIAAVRIAQAFLGSLTAVLTFILSILVFRDKTFRLQVATLAGLAVALSDELIFYCGQLLTESLYTFLFVLWIVTLLWCRNIKNRPVGDGAAAAAAIMHGVLILIRPVAGIFLPMVWWLLLQSKKSKARIVLYTFLVFLAVVPWSIRNYRVTGRFVPVSTNGGVNFYIGHNPHFGYWSTGDKTAIRENTDLDEVEESSLFFRLGLDYIIGNPWQDGKHNLMKIGYLFTTTWKPWPWFNHGRELRFPPLPTWIAWPWSLPAILLVLVGLVLALVRREPVVFLVLVCLGQVLACVIFFARARFRAPLIPLLAIFMAYGIVISVKSLKDYIMIKSRRL